MFKSSLSLSHVFIDLAIVYVMLSAALILIYIIIHWVLVGKKIIPKAGRYSQLMVCELLFFLFIVTPIVIAFIWKSDSMDELSYTIPIIDIFAIFPLICHYAFVNVDASPNNINLTTQPKNIRFNMIGDQLLLIVSGCMFAIFIHFDVYQQLFKTIFNSFNKHSISSIIHLITVFIPFILIGVGHILSIVLIIYSLKTINNQPPLQKKITFTKLLLIASITISIVAGATVTFWYDDSLYSFAILGTYDFVFILTAAMAYLFFNGSNIIRYNKHG
ncbi:MAG: hypothetical protein LBG49_00795 [Mycoplasmataceae bacterium]|nr:hypothetical protein [Mycoplasmataceae bacterium]